MRMRIAILLFSAVFNKVSRYFAPYDVPAFSFFLNELLWLKRLFISLVVPRAILTYVTLHDETHSLPIASTNKCASRVRESFNPPSLRERRVQQSFPFIRRQCAKLSSWTARWLAARRRVSSARCICSAVLGRETWKFIPVEIHAFEFLAGWRAELSFLR